MIALIQFLLATVAFFYLFWLAYVGLWFFIWAVYTPFYSIFKKIYPYSTVKPFVGPFAWYSDRKSLRKQIEKGIEDSKYHEFCVREGI